MSPARRPATRPHETGVGPHRMRRLGLRIGLAAALGTLAGYALLVSMSPAAVLAFVAAFSLCG